MGHVYARDILGLDAPARRVCCRSARKRARATTSRGRPTSSSSESSLNFVGNVEGRDIYNGQCDVVVTDGFTGNVALKISESLAEMLGAMIKEELTRDLRSRMGAALALPAFQRFRRRVDYTEMGGAPLLGIDGAAIICHGASPVKAIKNAVRVAAEWAKAGLNEHIKAALEAELARERARGGPGMTRARIIGVGALRPKRILTNADLEKMVDTNDEWIVQRTGIRERRIVDENEATSDLAVQGRAAGARAGQPRSRGHRLHRGRHDHARTCIFPTTGQHRAAQARLRPRRLGRHAGGVRGLDLQPVDRRAVHPDRQVPARALHRRRDAVAHHRLDRPRHVRAARRRRGRGRAGGVRRTSSGIIDVDLYSDGQYWDLLYMPGGGSRHPATHETVDARMHFAKMKGNEVFKVAVRMFVECAERHPGAQRLHGGRREPVHPAPGQPAHHRGRCQARELPMDRVFVNVDRYGNTGAASVYVALEEAIAAGRLKRGDLVLLAALGGGFAWGAALITLVMRTACDSHRDRVSLPGAGLAGGRHGPRPSTRPRPAAKPSSRRPTRRSASISTPPDLRGARRRSSR